MRSGVIKKPADRRLSEMCKHIFAHPPLEIRAAGSIHFVAGDASDLWRSRLGARLTAPESALSGPSSDAASARRQLY
jgi:hypothetical protein